MAGRRRRRVGLLIGVLLAGIAVWACGGGNGDRDTKVCRSCDPDVARGCLNECRELCVPDDPSCESRCASQCDECKRDLVCGACRDGCTGTLLRCAPQNEVVECEDGTYGGAPSIAHSRE